MNLTIDDIDKYEISVLILDVWILEKKKKERKVHWVLDRILRIVTTTNRFNDNVSARKNSNVYQGFNVRRVLVKVKYRFS